MSETPSPQKRITNSVDDEVNLRRERGRRAQATFRQRKAQETHRLVNQNRQLIRAVERVVEVTSGEERPELLNAVTNLSEIAGVSDEHWDTRRRVRYELHHAVFSSVGFARGNPQKSMDESSELHQNFNPAQ
ncbi:hypothetical protein QQS21_004959 [Conoideocrella luteorostrata]|uniref:BZIP domain-containing protein n=1 Tax=Conoideocrella luteorostrata TaxID=1105319 RepID=A0AAJ0CQD3_9HYPO|nr:hypothetical protein QQS21_004959 [Conoideocrella luteorostrata]